MVTRAETDRMRAEYHRNKATTKKEQRIRGKSSTSGKSKGGTCVASRQDRFCAGYSRAARPQYKEMYQAFRKRKNGV